MTNEQKVQRSILAFLRSKGIFCWTNRTQGTWDAKRNAFRKNYDPYFLRGVSDVLGVLPSGIALAIEVKTDNTPWSKKTYPSKEQKLFLENVIKLNGVGFVARSVDDVERTLKDLGYL